MTKQVITHIVVPAKPNNYIGLSLFNLLCCFLPLGIVGLIYSMKVSCVIELHCV